MNPEEKEKQDKTLAKLQWLNERVKIDFRGNPSPFETKKTLRSVEQGKRAKARGLAGDVDFLPFWHGTRPLALDATRCDYVVSGAPVASAVQTDEPATTYGGQRIDPTTGLTEVQLALSWDVPHAAPSHVPCAQRGEDAPPSRVTRDAPYMRTLTPDERAAVCRELNVAHPKCTVPGTRRHRDRWANSTQLAEPIVKPVRSGPNTALQQRNAVRAVHLLPSS